MDFNNYSKVLTLDPIRFNGSFIHILWELQMTNSIYILKILFAVVFHFNEMDFAYIVTKGVIFNYLKGFSC